MTITSELVSMFKSLQNCLDLRDKYIVQSRQSLGDNPRDYDGHSLVFQNTISDPFRVKVDVNRQSKNLSCPSFEPWNIYPPPPPPHWRHVDEKLVNKSDASTRAETGFVFETCKIPDAHPWSFSIDDKGVFQVYRNIRGKIPLLQMTYLPYLW